MFSLEKLWIMLNSKMCTLTTSQLHNSEIYILSKFLFPQRENIIFSYMALLKLYHPSADVCSIRLENQSPGSQPDVVYNMKKELYT